MAFKARKVSKGLFEVHGVEAFIEKRIAALWKVLQGGSKKVAAARTPSKPKKLARKPVRKAPKAMKLAPTPVEHLVHALHAHPRRLDLVKAGKVQRDQLLRSLIPLYLAQKLQIEVSSGTTSDFWKLNGVKYLAPNAAKALREHVGYARLTKTGRQITPNGVKYVETAIGARARRAA